MTLKLSIFFFFKKSKEEQLSRKLEHHEQENINEKKPGVFGKQQKIWLEYGVDMVGNEARMSWAISRHLDYMLHDWRRQWQPTPVLLPGKSHGWRSLVGCSLRGHEESWLSDFSFTFHFHALEKEMATHSSGFAWKIPGTAEPGGLRSMGSHRVGHDWSDLAAAVAAAVAWLDFHLGW